MVGVLWLCPNFKTLTIMSKTKIIERLRDEGLFDGVWQSPFATFTFSNTKKTDTSGQPMVRARVSEKDGNRRQTLYYPADMILNYMAMKSKIQKVN